MKFYGIKPAQCAIEAIEAAAPQDAYAALGLSAMAVDHGIICRTDNGGGVAIVVYEYSLFEPVEKQKWFSILGELYGGNALLYGFDASGETCEFEPPPPVMFYRSIDEVEAAIERGEVKRPGMSVNGAMVWQWPDKRGM